MEVPGAGSGSRSFHDERLADVLVTIWNAQAAALTYGRNSIPWGMLRELGQQLLEGGDDAEISKGVLTVQLRIIKTHWDTVIVPSGSRYERMGR
jgi:hypothetical protein